MGEWMIDVISFALTCAVMLAWLPIRSPWMTPIIIAMGWVIGDTIIHVYGPAF
jgi:hypothetical protein